MNSRCPSNSFLKPVYCKKMKLVFVDKSIKWGGAIANMISGQKDTWGGLYKVNNDNLAALDCFEGSKYERRTVEVFGIDGKVDSAITYLRKTQNEKEKKPSQKYMDIIIEGAMNCGLSDTYIEMLQKIPTHE